MTARQGDENGPENAENPSAQPAPDFADDQPYTPEDLRFFSELDTPAPSPNGTTAGTTRDDGQTPSDEGGSGLERREVVHGKRRASDYIRIRYTGRRHFRPTGGNTLEATPEALAPQSGAGRTWERVRRVLLGQRLTSAEQENERLTKIKGLAILSSDAISSVAYATEASLGVLILVSAATMQVNLIIAGCIALLMVIVGTSYRQTIYAYPQGGGSYIVARENLGDLPGLVAAAALLIDYTLTVSVSVSAGIDALVSAFTPLMPYSVELGVLFIFIIMIINLRGVRESGTIFAAPTYLFIACFLIMIVAGVISAALSPGGLFAHVTAVKTPSLGWGSENLSILLILTAFASGCSAMTGVEAISNGVPAFKKPETHNAARTLTWMIAILVTLFLGTTFLAWRFGIAPHFTGEPTVTSQIASVVFHGPFVFMYYLLQFATLIILVLAANTSFSGFPWLSSILARDDFLPHQFSHRGGRLAFSTGIIVLSVLAGTLMVVFHGNTAALINLYALGVFTAFTLSQTGMVVHWWRLRDSADRHWRRSMVINSSGAIATGIVAIVITVAKFDHGAWIVVVLIPLFVLLFKAISRHYASTRKQMAELPVSDLRTMRQLMIVPIATFDRVALRSIAYAQALANEVIVVHVATDATAASTLRQSWNEWRASQQPAQEDRESTPPRLVVIESPYRSLIPPLVFYVDALRDFHPEAVITVVLPEFVPAHWWERALHNQTALRLKLAFYSQRNVVVANVPYHLS